jgi:murein DD-endopeptidase MepM/ murein hydrolase activator NlpD
MRALLRSAVLAVAVALLAWAAVARVFPALQRPLAVIALLREPPPPHLPVPVQGVTARQLASSWAAPRPGGRRHEGIDIFARRDTPVLSTTRGIVVRRGSNDLGGNVVIVLGPGGHRHYYAHLARFADASIGEWVEAGHIIGYVGNSGNARATAPHLHYGIYTPAGAIDPHALLTRGSGSRPLT